MWGLIRAWFYPSNPVRPGRRTLRVAVGRRVAVGADRIAVASPGRVARSAP